MGGDCCLRAPSGFHLSLDVPNGGDCTFATEEPRPPDRLAYSRASLLSQSGSRSFAIVMRYGVVAREEAYLEERFGDAYRAYKTRVRRWL